MLKTVVLSGIQQKKNGALREFTDRFTKIVVEVGGSNNSLRCWIFEKGLRLNCMFWEKLVMKGVGSMSDLLT